MWKPEPYLGNQNQNHLPWELEPEKHTLITLNQKSFVCDQKPKELDQTKKLCVEIRTKKTYPETKKFCVETKTKKAYPANPKLEKLGLWPKPKKLIQN